MVIWKFSASLDWSLRKALSDRSLLISQTISGTMKPRMMPDRWVSIASVRSSCEAGIAASFSSLMVFPRVDLDGSGPLPSNHLPGPASIRARHRHPTHQDRAGEDVRAAVDVAADRLDGLEHALEVAGDGDPIDRPRD